MNCLPNRTTEQASGQNRVLVSLIASETTLLSGTDDTPTLDEMALEAEMNRRAGVITDVLARIMEEPVAFRHWGLNE